MPLTDDDKESIRYHLGYPGIRPTGVSFGTVVPIEATFLLEANMDVLREGNVVRVQRLVCTLEKIECLMQEFLPDAAVNRLASGLEINQGSQDKLEREYWRWAGRLADILAVPFYPYAARFTAGRGPRVQSVPVVS